MKIPENSFYLKNYGIIYKIDIDKFITDELKK